MLTLISEIFYGTDHNTGEERRVWKRGLYFDRRYYRKLQNKLWSLTGSGIQSKDIPHASQTLHC
jgi:hypothetical protein